MSQEGCWAVEIYLKGFEGGFRIILGGILIGECTISNQCKINFRAEDFDGLVHEFAMLGCVNQLSCENLCLATGSLLQVVGNGMKPFFVSANQEKVCFGSGQLSSRGLGYGGAGSKDKDRLGRRFHVSLWTRRQKLEEKAGSMKGRNCWVSG